MIERKQVHLRWTGEGLVFEGGGEKHPPLRIDGASKAGPSPTEALLLSLAGCMAIDVRLILDKSRVPLETLEVDTIGERAETDPRRYTHIRMVFRLKGPGAEHESRVARAIQLSRDKYCSVFHTFRSDLPIETAIELI
jgi:putative redox protein